MPQTPNTVIEFFHVPWTNNYRDLRYFSSASVRDSWFEARGKHTFPSSPITHAQPVKLGVPYTISSPYDDMYKYNYCRFKNKGENWVYCFVTEWSYSSENSCTFNFEIDHYQNYIGTMVFGDCFIERQHMKNDEVTLTPEPIQCNQFMRPYKNSVKGGIDDYYGLLIATSKPDGDTSTMMSYVDDTPFNFYFKIGSITDMMINIAVFTSNGIANNILGVFLLPKKFYGIGDATNKVVTKINDINFTRPTKIEDNVRSYTPKNKKVLYYPYTWLEAIDHQGQKQQYRYEEGTTDTLAFRIRSMSGLNSTIELEPLIVGSGVSRLQNILTDITCPLGFSADGGALWTAQNGQQVATNIGLGVATTGLSVASAVFSGGATLPLVVGAVGGAMSTANTVINANVSEATASSPSISTPNSKMYLAQQNILGFSFYEITPCISEAKRIDSYFTRFGYAYGQIGEISPTNRDDFYYVKTGGAIIRGNVPNDAIRTIEDALNNGVTFWHKDSIGNYD